MNLPEFLKETDRFVGKATKVQLDDFIHESARTLPESERESFLNLLSDTIDGRKKPDRKISSNLKKEVEESLVLLNEINAGSRCLNSHINEEWDDWYDSSGDEFIYTDPEHVVDDVSDAIRLVHLCLDAQLYQSGYELSEALAYLDITVAGDAPDYGCDDSFSLSELYYRNMLTGDYKDFCKEALYLTYMNSDRDDRADDLYLMIDTLHADVSLQDIMQIGTGDLPDFDEFLKSWIEYLGGVSGHTSNKLLEEAQSIIPDDSIRLENSKKYVDTHPEMLLDFLSTSKKSPKKLAVIGEDALKMINSDNALIRSSIAILTAGFYLSDGKKGSAELCWIEAFRSTPSAVNFMRVRFFDDDYEEDSKKINDIIAHLTSVQKTSSVHQFLDDYFTVGDYKLNEKNYYMTCFLNGDFDMVITKGMSVKEPLGWSYTFMKEGIALFIILLSEGEKLTSGMSRMVKIIKDGVKYTSNELCQGTSVKPGDLSDEEFLWRQLCIWRSEQKLSEDQRKKYIKRIDELISFRVEGIMSANRRNYYNECAAFAAAFGEMLESCGYRGAKQQLLEEYRSRYSRRSAFRQELQSYGLNYRK